MSKIWLSTYAKHTKKNLCHLARNSRTQVIKGLLHRVYKHNLNKRNLRNRVYKFGNKTDETQQTKKTQERIFEMRLIHTTLFQLHSVVTRNILKTLSKQTKLIFPETNKTALET